LRGFLYFSRFIDSKNSFYPFTAVCSVVGGRQLGTICPSHSAPATDERLIKHGLQITQNVITAEQFAAVA